MIHLLSAEIAAKSNEVSDVWKYVLPPFTGVIAAYITSKIEDRREKNRLKKEEAKKMDNMDATLKHNNEIQRNIKDVLIQIQGYTECSRASLYNYHNGTKTHYGYSMNFVSMVEEKTDGIVVPLIDTFQKVPAALFRPILERVDESDTGHVVVRIEDLNEEDRLIMDKYQNSVCHHFKVGNSVWEGVVELAWVNKKGILSEGEVDHVQALVNNISDLQRRLIKA